MYKIFNLIYLQGRILAEQAASLNHGYNNGQGHPNYGGRGRGRGQQNARNGQGHGGQGQGGQGRGGQGRGGQGRGGQGRGNLGNQNGGNRHHPYPRN